MLKTWRLASAFLFVAGTTALSAPEPRYVMLLDFIPALVTQIDHDDLVYTENGVSIVRVEEAEIETWSSLVHETFGGCGGFLDVTEDVRDGRSAELMVWEENLRREQPIARHHFPVSRSQAIEKLVAGAKKDRLAEFVGELATFPDRSATSENGASAAAFIKNAAGLVTTNLPKLAVWNVETKSFLYSKQPSVIATLAGTDPSLPHILVGAHMDTLSGTMPGADDDASGSAVVMEVLRVIADSQATFKHTIDFAWYSAEERGLVGSSFVVKEFKAKKIAVAAAMQMDMVGWDSSNDSADIYFLSDNTNQSLTDAVKKMATTYAGAKVGDTKCGYACSDHVNWHRAGVPVVVPFEASFANMNKVMHTSKDVQNLVSPEHALRFARVALAYLGELAKLETTR